VLLSRSSALRVVLCVAAAALLRCGGQPGGAADAGSDGGAVADAGSDAGSGAGVDAGPDAGTDGGFDAGHDAGTDAGPDAGAPWTFVPTTTLASLTQNNTSACGSDAGPCLQAWDQTHTVKYSSGSYEGTTATVTGFWDAPVAPGPRAAGSAYGYVSKVPVGKLLPGQSVPIWVETQNWWDTTSGHIVNGENDGNATQVADQVADHISRGFAGQVVDWIGPGKASDQSLPYIMTAAEASGGAYQFAVMIDKGYFQYGCGNTTDCLEQGLGYIATQYGGSPAYLKDAQGHPIVFYFVNDYYPGPYGVLTDGGIDAGGTVFVMYEPNGFPGDDPPKTIGEYGWVNPSDNASTSNVTGSQGTFPIDPDFGFKDLTSFLSAADSNQSAFIAAQAYKGFDDNLATWSLNRVIDQECGLTWLQTFDHQGSFGGSAGYQSAASYLAAGKKMDMVMVDTWDDYEEGTELETGIDNCLAGLSVSLAGSTLSWTPTWGADPMNSAVSGSEATVYEYSIYLAAPGGTNVMWLADVACSNGSCGHTLDVSKYGISGGPYVFYVQAIGQPSILNHLAGPTTTSYTAN
jgi:hypothetical protein